MSISSVLKAGALKAGAFGVLAVCACAGDVLAQGGADGYRLPPRDIVDMVDAPPTPSVSVSPDGSTLVLVHRENLPPIREMARPMERLAGMRLDASTNGRHGPRRFVGLSIRDVESGRERRVGLPEDVGVGYPSWAPNGERFAFTVTEADGIELWVCEVASGRAARVADRMNLAAGGFDWMSDSETLLAQTIPSDRGERPKRSAVPTGPVMQENDGRTAPVRTYQDLLSDTHDEAMFDWLMVNQIVRVDGVGGGVTPVGGPGLYTVVSASPDGEYLLVGRLEKPYSYLVTYWSFPITYEVWSATGEHVSTIAEKPLRDSVPIGGVETGRRSIGWQSNAPATLVWAEALDGGDPKAEVEHRDRIMMLDAPFTDEPTEVTRIEDRYSGLRWVGQGELAMLSEYDRDTRWTRTWLVDFGAPDSTPRLVFERNTQDRMADPGRPVSALNEYGRSVAHVDGGHVFLTGSGATEEGDRPFLRKMSLASFEQEELWRNEGENYEYVVELLADDATRVLTSYETTDTPPNYFIRDLDRETRVAVTEFEDPQPELRGVHKELVKYERDDGVELSATLYLPADYEEGTRLPLVVWAYPREFNDARTASQVSGSPHRFTRIDGYSHLFMLTQGYAVLDRAAMPVIGSDPETVNDTFIDQIVAGGQAAIDFAVERGIADRGRVAVGGHSYGAFMTANLLAHSDIFAAGIARSGAYNRTLTPFGFQAERRTFWEAPEVYFNLSPFMHADRINEPLLLIHGEADNNSGTFPIQSERLYHAVKGHGGTVRLVMLPHESHGYRARESVLHVLAEQVAWLDRHVKRTDESPASESYE
ncbi:MAG: prolyl oligopeptidase family serine peptidase [Phycisphaerales bacterium JB040]